MRFGGLSPLLIAAFLLAIAALALFLLPGILSNRGGGGDHKTPKPTVAASVTEAPPTTPPSPTPRSYTVKSGDSLTKIAQRFDVAIANLACYNSIANINALQIGQVLLIPPPDYACPSASPTRKP